MPAYEPRSHYFIACVNICIEIRQSNSCASLNLLEVHTVERFEEEVQYVTYISFSEKGRRDGLLHNALNLHWKLFIP